MSKNEYPRNMGKPVAKKVMPEKVAAFLSEVREEAEERARHCVSIDEFIAAAEVMFELWNRHKSSSGLTALFAVGWALDPNRIDFPISRTCNFDSKRSLAWSTLVNGVMLGEGYHIEALEAHLGDERSGQLLMRAKEELEQLKTAV